MTLAKKNARFAYNNYFKAETVTTTASKAGYPFANSLSSIRSKLWKPENIFEIHQKNCKIYIDSTSYEIPQGSYTREQLVTQFNSISGIGASLLSSGGRFLIGLGSSRTLNISNQLDSAWETLGFLGSSDRTGVTLGADERRYNTGFWIKVDLKIPQLLDFASLIPEANEIFSCNTAQIKLQGNNMDLWEEPPVNLDFEVSSQGAFFAGDPNQPCRYWRIFVDDKKNEEASIAVAFAGSSVICKNTNIATGFNRRRQDTSIVLYSENGALYVDKRPKILSLSSIGVQLLKGEELVEMEQLFYDLGIEKPFFLCIDPKKQVSSSLAQMTHYVAVTSDLTLEHVLRDYYNLSIELREVL